MTNGIIDSGLRADVMRTCMENKELLANAGAIYVGTGNASSINGVDIPITASLEKGADGSALVANSAAPLGINYTMALSIGPDANAAINPLGRLSGSTIGASSIAFGANVCAVGARSIALGAGSNAAGADSIVMGQGAQALGSRAVALLPWSVATANDSVAIGVYSNVAGRDSLAVGYSAKALGPNSIALGRLSVGGSDNSVAIGVSANASAANSVQIGPGINTIADSLQYKNTVIVNGNGEVDVHDLVSDSADIISGVSGTVTVPIAQNQYSIFVITASPSYVTGMISATIMYSGGNVMTYSGLLAHNGRWLRFSIGNYATRTVTLQITAGTPTDNSTWTSDSVTTLMIKQIM